jgi:hypothetical protein
MVEVLALVCDSEVGAADAVSAARDDEAAEVFQAFTPFLARRYTVYAVLAVRPDTVKEPPDGVTELQLVPSRLDSYPVIDPVPVGAVNDAVTVVAVAFVCASEVGAGGVVSAVSVDDAVPANPDALRARSCTEYEVFAASADWLVQVAFDCSATVAGLAVTAGEKEHHVVPASVEYW